MSSYAVVVSILLINFRALSKGMKRLSNASKCATAKTKSHY